MYHRTGCLILFNGGLHGFFTLVKILATSHHYPHLIDDLAVRIDI